MTDSARTARRKRVLHHAIVLTIFSIFLGAMPAAAHAELVKSTPAAGQRLAAAPARITLWFDEELDTQRSEFQVTDVDGRPVGVPAGRVDLFDPDHASLTAEAPALPDGAYRVRWRVVTIDDDGVTEGQFDFVIGDAAQLPAADTAQGAPWFTWPLLVSAALLVGAVWWMLWRRRRNANRVP